jgi:ABC-2 type transport system ATP-binding protein
MIELKDVTKKFGTKTAVDGISFKIEKGDIVGFLGPNAAGKTTTMRIITGFFPPTSGQVKIAGYDISKDSIAVKEKIGYMPENVPLYKELTVYSYLKFIAEIKGIPKDKIESRIEKAMKEVGISQVKNTIIGKLSKGFKQRVGLAQAIINDPEILILDEPTVGLDPVQIKEIRSLIKNMKGERTIILSTHILPEVSMTCDKVIIINEGKIIAQEDVKNLTNVSQKGTQIYVEVEAPKSQFISEIKKLKAVENIEEKEKISEGIYSYNLTINEQKDIKDIVNKIVKNDWGLLELRRQQVTLEDVFLKLVTKEEL